MNPRLRTSLQAAFLLLIVLTGWAAPLWGQIGGGGGGVSQSYVDNAITTLRNLVPSLAPVQSVNTSTGNVVVQPGNFIGSFTVANLLSQKPCDGSAVPYGSIAYVTDLGGGANNVKCLGTNGVNAWQHFSLGTPSTNSTNFSTTQTVTWTPLVSPPVQQLTGTIATLVTVTLQIQTQNLYPGYQGCVITPPTLLGILQIQVQGLAAVSLLAGTHSCWIYNGTALVQISS